MTFKPSKIYPFLNFVPILLNQRFLSLLSKFDSTSKFYKSSMALTYPHVTCLVVRDDQGPVEAILCRGLLLLNKIAKF